MDQRVQEFEALRSLAHQQVKLEIAARIKNNPTPNSEELRVGCFIEMLEPQVRAAVFYMNRIGYKTFMSGFWGGGAPGLQRIDGKFRIDVADRAKLASLGARTCVDVRPPFLFAGKSIRRTFLEFEAEVPDLEAIRKQWDAIVSVLTARKRPARRDSSKGISVFRYQFGGEAIDLTKLEKVIKELEKYNKGRDVMKRWYLLRDDVIRGERNLAQSVFF